MLIMRTSDLYYDYPYRRNTEGLKGNHYVPLAEVSDHKYSLSKKEWKKIVEVFSILLFMFLLDGNSFTLPGNFGVIRLRKRKVDKPHRSLFSRCLYYVKVNYGVTDYNEAKKIISENKINVKWFNKSTDNHQISLKWTPHKNTRCSSFWRVWMPRHMHKLVFNFFEKDKKALDNLLE